MPIDLLNLASQGPSIKYTPKFYDKKLTGNGVGGKTSVINNYVQPTTITFSNKDVKDQYLLLDQLDHKQNDTTFGMRNGTTVVQSGRTIKDEIISLLPFNSISFAMIDTQAQKVTNNKHLCVQDLFDNQLGEWHNIGNTGIKIRMFPTRLKLHQEKNVLVNKWKRNLVPAYRIELLHLDLTKNLTTKLNGQELYAYVAGQDKKAYLDRDDCLAIKNALFNSKKSNQYLIINTMDPKTVFAYIGQQMKKQANMQNGDLDLMNYLNNYNLYDALSQVSKSFQTNLLHFAKILVETSKDDFTNLQSLFANINKMQVPLDQYQQMYQYLNKSLKTNKAAKKQDILNTIINSNLNFRFNELLTELESNKRNLATIPQHDQVNPQLTLEQANAVKSASPLTLVEAGAGTGKSSVLLNRIKYLLDGGVDPTDVLILSFTNAAAQHIKRLYPNVKSMTINALVNQIYRANYQRQVLVMPKTFANSLKIEYQGKQKDDFIKNLISAMDQLTQRPDNENFNNLDNGFQILTTLINKNPQRVINICTKLGQTTFDLQMAICYCGFTQINLPVDIVAKHILVDEVQDNSTFDFMFLLRYIIHERASFFIVGDASQTLYAFRNANPYALNILRTSKLFDVFQLTTNFRSKPEVLTYANVILNQISANTFANIQLKANNLTAVTIDTFKQIVKISHIRRGPKHTQEDLLQNDHLIHYVNHCLQRNEKITFLTYDHTTLNLLMDTMKMIYGTDVRNVFVDISSHQPIETNYFSDFWANMSKDKRTFYRKIAHNSVFDVIKHDFIFYKDNSGYQQYAENQWNEFSTIERANINNLNQRYIVQQINFDKYLDNLVGLMVRYEIRHNNLLQQNSQANNTPEIKKDKISKSNFIFSTIHSVKGLEFDNVVLLINPKPFNSNAEEADKRTCYVGLTRAKNSEFLLACDNSYTDDSLLLIDYQLAINGIK